MLMVDAGYMVEFNKLSTGELTELAKQVPPGLIGVERSEEMLEWIWENFSAVAGDHPAFESYRTSAHGSVFALSLIRLKPIMHMLIQINTISTSQGLEHA